LQPSINSIDVTIAEDKRGDALQSLRRQNFEVILDWLGIVGVEPSARVLDVGCGHGWFVMAAITRGYEAIGVEPDNAIAAVAEANGARVRQGSFPEMVKPGETFDVIVFNDVFEHLLDPPGAIADTWRCLKPSGVLVINLPLQTGTFYRLAHALDRVGVHGPLRRMWQLGFPSPHRSYFSADQLSQFVARHGFHESARHTLPSVTVKGLWERLRYDPNQSAIAAVVMWPVLAFLAPFLRFLPADIGVQIFRRTN
jgi:SAM-dependent methyltransferase